MKMDLSVNERLMVSLVLPGEGNVMTIRLVDDLKNRLGFTPEEAEKLKVETNEETGDAGWDHQAEKELGEVAFEFNRLERKLIVPALERVIKRLNLLDKLKLAHLTLYEKFAGKDKTDALIEVLEKAAIKQATAKEKAEAEAEKESIQRNTVSSSEAPGEEETAEPEDSADDGDAEDGVETQTDA